MAEVYAEDLFVGTLADMASTRILFNESKRHQRRAHDEVRNFYGKTQAERLQDAERLVTAVRDTMEWEELALLEAFKHKG